MVPVDVLMILLASIATVHIGNLHIEVTNIRKNETKEKIDRRRTEK